MAAHVSSSGAGGMSARDNRRENRSARSWEREMEIPTIIERNRRIAEVMAECARLHGGGGAIAEAKYRFWSHALEHLHPFPGQARDTTLADVVIMKGRPVYLVKGDYEAAERLSKQSGLPFAECGKIYSELNRMNLPSYLGGRIDRERRQSENQEEAEEAGRAGAVHRKSRDGRQEPRCRRGGLQIALRFAPAGGSAARSARVERTGLAGREALVTLNTIPAMGRTDLLANAKSSYWVTNTVTGETIYLEPSSDGLFADHAQARRYGHQVEDTDGASIAMSGVTGIATWHLGTRATFVTLSAADIAVVYTPVCTFGSTGALATPVVTSLADQVTVVRQNNKADPTPQLEVKQGENSVFLTRQNCADLAPQLGTIGAT
jgi:hypothetical protein